MRSIFIHAMSMHAQKSPQPRHSRRARSSTLRAWIFKHLAAYCWRYNLRRFGLFIHVLTFFVSHRIFTPRAPTILPDHQSGRFIPDKSNIWRDCCDGYYDWVKEHINEGAPLNESDHCGDPPMVLAAGNGHTSCVELLMSEGAVRTRSASECMFLPRNTTTTVIVH